MIDGAAAVVIEVLGVLSARRFGIGERVDHAHAVDGILRKPSTTLGGLMPRIS